MVTLSQVKTIGKDYEKQIRDAGWDLKQITYHLITSKRTTRMYGCCEYQAMNKVSADIYINQWLTHEKDVREVIGHELTHAIKQCHGVGHNKVWRDVAYKVCHELLGLEGGHTRTNSRRLDTQIGGISIKFQMTLKGANMQTKKAFKDVNTVHQVVVETNKLSKYEKLHTDGIIEILEKEKI